MKKPLTAQDIAALAAGAAGAAGAETTPAAETKPEDKPEGTTDPEAKTEPAAATESAADAKSESALVAFLQGQVTAQSTELVNAKVELATANSKLVAMQAELDGMKANFKPLMTIAAQSVKNMRVALNLADVDMSAMSAESVLTEHAASSEAFNKAFKAGGVAAVTMPEQKSTTTAPNLTGAAAARFAATKI